MEPRQRRVSPKTGRFRIFLVDGMEVVRLGLAKIIAAASAYRLRRDGRLRRSFDLMERHRPHLIIAEPFHENRDGIMWIKDLAREFPQTKILVAPQTPKPPMPNVSCGPVPQVIG